MLNVLLDVLVILLIIWLLVVLLIGLNEHQVILSYLLEPPQLPTNNDVSDSWFRFLLNGIDDHLTIILEEEEDFLLAVQYLLP